MHNQSIIKMWDGNVDGNARSNARRGTRGLPPPVKVEKNAI